VDTLEAALWCVQHAADFREAILLAANLGDDADTVAAVTGQLADAIWGEAGILENWLAKLAWCNRIRDRAKRLLHCEADRSGVGCVQTQVGATRSDPKSPPGPRSA
jgi:ADP-ribosyl-[dinitrogen reductase] hydrolase